MTWREQYQQPSFRGVPFKVGAAGSDHRRELAIHRFVKNEEPFVEDLGRAPRRFRLEAYVLGLDYFAARDRLQEALDAPGSGELIHPYRGALQVTVLEYTIGEDSRDGGQATFSIMFLETGKAGISIATPSAPARAAASSSLYATKSEAAAASALVVTKVPQYVPEAAANQWESVWKKFAEVRLTGPLDQVAHFRDLVLKAGDKVVDQLADPYHWAHDTSLLFQSIKDAAVGRYEAFRVYATFFGIHLPDPAGSSPNQRHVWTNQKAVVLLSRSQALAGAVHAAAANAWETSNDADAARELCAAELEAQALLVDDDESFAELGALRATIFATIPSPSATLPHLDFLELRSSTTSLTLAQRVYADATRNEEIARRNAVAHPGMLPALVPLEVLVDV